MNVELIKIDPGVAEMKLRAYRKGIAERHHSRAAQAATAEWTLIEAGYKAAAKGLPLIELSKAFAMGGWDERGRPKFAVARADERNVRCEQDGALLVFWPLASSRYRRTSKRITVPQPPNRPKGWNGWGLTAIVPLIPPDVLPRPDIDLSRRLILWEADWQAAPIDPLLLLPIGGDLYAVEAAWDLTPLERAVLQERRP